jgi:hypothetical protein
MSCFHTSLDEQTIKAAGEKSATCYHTSIIVPSDNGSEDSCCHTSIIVPSDNGSEASPEEKTQQKGGMLEPRYDQDRNRRTEQDSRTNMTSQENEASKSWLLEYVDNLRKNINGPSQGSDFTDINKPKTSVLLRDPGYKNPKINSDPGYKNPKINSNFYNKSNPNYFLFLTEEGRLKLVEKLKKYCEWKERNEAGAISSRLENTLENEAIYKSIKEKIDGGSVPKSTDQRWKEVIRYLIDSYKDYCTENYDINEPDAILAQACSIYIKWNKILVKRFQSLGSVGELYSFYCEKEKKDRKAINTYELFLAQAKNSQFMDGLVNFYIQEKLRRLPPWEEINAILEKYRLPYKVDYTVDSANDAGKFILMKTTQEGTILIDLKALSSEERLMLDLMSWLFYFPELSSNDKKPVQIKNNVVIRLLDESSGPLDPELCKKLYEVIDNEFVQKRQIRVIMIDRHLDTAMLTPYHTRALETWKEVLGSKHPDVATSYNDLGLRLGAVGRHAEALEYYQKALKIWKEVLGDEHPKIVACYKNIALSLENMGRYREALDYLKKALGISKEV